MQTEVLLINPPFSRLENYRYFIRALGTKAVPPLGLAYLASVLKREGIKVKILDAIACEMNLKELAEVIWDSAPLIVGVTATTPMFCNAQEVVRLAKYTLPQSTVVLGGPHASALARQTLEEMSSLDFVVIGEGELTFLELVKAVLGNKEKEQIKGIGCRKNGTVVVNPSREYIEDLDWLPLPARHLLPMRLYRPSPINYRYLPATSVIASRGCPMQCIFCTKHLFGRQLRLRSPDNIFSELKELKEKYGVREIHFYDDTFTINKKWTKEVCKLIKELGLVWWCNGRVDDVDEDLLRLMKDAGCYRIYFGLESAHEKSLLLLKKNTEKKNIVSAFNLARRFKIETAAFMILGIPGETKEDIQESIRFVKSLGADHAVFSVLTPYPGTELYNRASDFGRMRHKGWNDFVMISDSPIFLAHSISEKDLKDALGLTYQSLVLSPRYVLNKIKEIFYSPHKFVLYLKGLFSFLRATLFNL